MSASNPAPEPAEIAGRFEVVQKLGAGAFGTVYKARDKVLGRLLAIKTIRMEGLAASQAGLGEMLERFRREAQVAAQLKHPGIVTIYDIGESEGISYISMELIDGIGLDHVIAESGRIPVERAAALAAQVADALDFAHRQRGRPPRHQAREHHDRGRRPGEGDGLRHRQADRLRRAPHARRAACSARRPT